MNRRMRSIPTARPSSFLTQKIKRDVNYSPAFRTFMGMEGAVEDGDYYIKRKIREYTNVAYSPSEVLTLVSLLRPAYQLKKVIDRKDLAEAVNRLQELQQLERVPFALKDQLATIQDYVKTLSAEKKNEVLNDLVNNQNPFPEYEDLDVDDIKRVVAPLYTKDDIMALYEKVPENAPEESMPDKKTRDLENEIEDLMVQAKLPEPLLPYSTIGMEAEEAPMEEPGSETVASALTTKPAMSARPEEELIIGVYTSSDLENMNISQLKKIAQKENVPYWTKYSKKETYPLSREDLISAILKTKEGEFVDASPAKVAEIRKERLVKERGQPEFRRQLQSQVMGRLRGEQDGEGVSDVIGSVLNKLMPRALKDIIFEKFVAQPTKKLFTAPKRY